jgi:hypothetical protein
MRASTKGLATVLVLAMCAAAAVAGAAAGEPGTVAPLLPAEAAPRPKTAAPAPSPAPSPTSPVPASAATRIPSPPPPPPPPPAAAVDTREAPPRRDGDDTSWGVLARGGYFGLPNYVADKLFTEHPEVTGSSVGGEIRYHGAGGGRGIASLGIGVESAAAKAAGDWQKSETDQLKHVTGEIKMLSVTMTGYWSIFPSWYLHPYVGLGIGVAHAVGSYKDQEEKIEVDYWIPVVHVPIGVAIELGQYLQLAAEARFIDGIALGGALQVRF